MKKVVEFLHNLGLSEAEIRIYVKLLELGRCSVTELAHSLNMNRVTAHFNIQSLIDSGLITHVKQGRSRELTAQPPEALKYLIEQKDKQLSEIHEQFKEALPTLSHLMPIGGSIHNKFDVKFYQGLNGVKVIYDEVLKSSELRAYVKVGGIESILPENLSLFPQVVSRKGIKMWEIVENSPRTREYVKAYDPKLYSYKFFPSAMNQSIFDYLIFDGKISMITGTDELSGIMIINSDIYLNAKSLFDMLWSLLPDPQESSLRI